MTDAEVNIPRHIEDEFYRYRMPVIKTTVTGRNQGRETVILNLKAIAKSLERRPEYIMKFFSLQLSCQTTCNVKKNHFSVHGNYEGEELAVVLDEFIDRFILCRGNTDNGDICGNPETEVMVGKQNIKLKCRACGSRSTVEDHRLLRFIRNKPPLKKDQDSEIDQGQKIKKAPIEIVWSVDVSRDAVNKRRQEAHNDEEGETEKEILPEKEALKELHKQSNEDIEPVEFEANVRFYQDAYGWSESATLQNVFKILFTPSQILSQIVPKSKYLDMFIFNEKDQRMILSCLEKLCKMKKELINSIVDILNSFYELELIDEDVFLLWHKTRNKRLDPRVTAAVRQKAQPFIDWLKEASSEESDSLSF
eukprot:TRINITY_DN11659_c0_g1_i1.p1 TRINITY_DN11659_c0_g1~~TRINITY_DN11659_c0_g1_i1.p1  ORF type:complete len:364 (-),score=81.49 TRINITY_DN11659_c0_g1_i1:75-1166(-)